MGVLVDKNIDGMEKVKLIVLEFLERNEIPYSLIENDDCESICIDLNFDNETFKSDFYYAPLMIHTSARSFCKVIFRKYFFCTVVVIYVMKHNTK